MGTSVEFGDYLHSINKSKKNLMRESNDPKAKSGYPAFYVRKLLSYHPDAIFFANETNCIPNLEGQMEYEYFLHVLPKRNRFATTGKAIKPDNLELVKRIYHYCDQQALAVLDLHTEADFEQMKSRLNAGGVEES